MISWRRWPEPAANFWARLYVIAHEYGHTISRISPGWRETGKAPNSSAILHSPPSAGSRGIAGPIAMPEVWAGKEPRQVDPGGFLEREGPRRRQRDRGKRYLDFARCGAAHQPGEFHPMAPAPPADGRIEGWDWRATMIPLQCLFRIVWPCVLGAGGLALFAATPLETPQVIPDPRCHRSRQRPRCATSISTAATSPNRCGSRCRILTKSPRMTDCNAIGRRYCRGSIGCSGRITILP